MRYLGVEEERLREEGGYWAAYEIERQPQLWRETFELVRERREDVKRFLEPLYARGDVDLLLVGAGSSGMAAACVERHAAAHTGFHSVRAVASTELVLQPEAYLDARRPVVLAAFGSSGSTPEIVACVRRAKETLENFHLMILNCTDDGVIVAENRDDPRALYVPLPSRTKGESFAATAEFTCLVFQAMLLFDIDHLDRYEALLPYLEDEARKFFAAPFLHEVVAEKTIAMTCMGSLEMRVLASEAALKAVEFSGGAYLSNCTSSLEFRHGPKLIMNSPVLALGFIYPDERISRYDLDMMSEIATDRNGGITACLSYRNLRDGDGRPSHMYRFEPHALFQEVPVAGVFLYALAMQGIAMLAALKFGVRADWPSTDDLVPKVANRVTIYA